jgi:hypothetical protein
VVGGRRRRRSVFREQLHIARFHGLGGYWRHNGFWLFDSPDVILELARDHDIDLTGTKLFYYELHEMEYDETLPGWRLFEPEPLFGTSVILPASGVLEGYDIVTFTAGGGAGCSPLSCNGLAAEVETNAHCLLGTLALVQRLLESGALANAEPGPYRVFAVHSVDWP